MATDFCKWQRFNWLMGTPNHGKMVGEITISIQKTGSLWRVPGSQVVDSPTRWSSTQFCIGIEHRNIFFKNNDCLEFQVEDESPYLTRFLDKVAKTDHHRVSLVSQLGYICFFVVSCIGPP